MASWQKTKDYQIDKICRVCLQTKAGMRPLFENMLPNMLTELSGIQISSNDGLPAQLCIQCVHSISRANAVREMILKSTQTLREYIQRKKEESEECDNKPQSFIEILSEPMNVGAVHQQQLITSSQLLQDFYNEQGQALSQQSVESQKEQAQESVPKEEKREEPEDDVYLQAVALQAATSMLMPGRHMCNLCHKEFKHSRWLKAHMRAHTNWIRANYKRPPTCNICSKSFKGPGMLRMHMKSHEAKQPKPPTCTVCKQTFETKAALYKHRQTHFEQKMHQCTVCSKNFYGAYALRSHMARHRGEKPHTCPTCSKRFYNSTDLKVHIRLHTGEKPLSCSVCGKHFRRHSTLCQHMQKHNGVKNHVCTMCEKAFFDICKLKAHLRVHTGEKPYKCTSCSRSFSQQSALAYHTWTHASERPRRMRTKALKGKGAPQNSCQTCNQAFATRAEMRSHNCSGTADNTNTPQSNGTTFNINCIACGQHFTSRIQYYNHRKQHRLLDQHTQYTCPNCRNVIVGYVYFIKHMSAHKMVSNEKSARETNMSEELDDDVIQESTAVSAGNKMMVVPKNNNELVEIKDTGKKYKCGHCPKVYTELQPLQKHVLTHSQQQVEIQSVNNGVQLQLPTVQHPQGLLQLHQPTHVQLQGQQAYPVISSVQSLQLQQQQQHVQVTTQQPQLVQTIQLHPHSQPIQIHAVGVHQVQAQQQLHVASSSCQSVLPNIVQIQPATVAMSGLPGQQDLTGGNIAHRIILQPQSGHPTTVYLHH